LRSIHQEQGRCLCSLQYCLQVGHLSKNLASAWITVGRLARGTWATFCRKCGNCGPEFFDSSFCFCVCPHLFHKSLYSYSFIDMPLFLVFGTEIHIKILELIP
jgi:hypothetical protein